VPVSQYSAGESYVVLVKKQEDSVPASTPFLPLNDSSNGFKD